MTTFTHTPRPPHVSAAPHHLQRRFGPPHRDPNRFPESVIPKTGKESHARLSVFRSGGEDAAELEFAMGLGTQIRLEVCMTPNELRELAARLLDAAHDIEANPAAKLMEPMAAEECPA